MEALKQLLRYVVINPGQAFAAALARDRVRPLRLIMLPTPFDPPILLAS